MSVIHNDLLLSTDEATGYNLTKSLRFRNSAGAYLSRTPSTTGTGGGKTFTYSCWAKIDCIGNYNWLLIGGLLSSSADCALYIDSVGQMKFNDRPSGAYVNSTAVYRDPSAWYHFIFAVDTTQGTASNRIKMYVNGVQTTSFSSTNYPSQNTVLNIGINQVQRICTRDDGNTSSMYLTETHFIDGQQLTPSSFGETDSITGVWKPKRYTGTYGTNGFYLPFTDVALTSGSNAGLGKDFSGNGNYWNTNNISVTAGVTYDSMTDVPTLTSATASNYPTLNPLVQNSYIAASNGNLTATSTTNNVALIPSTMAFPPGGKYYFELTCQTAIGTNFYQSIGIWGVNQFSSYFTTSDSTYYSYGALDGKKYNAGVSASYGATWTNGDVVAAALDLVNGTLTFYKNGVSQGVAYTGIDTTIPFYAATYCYTTQCSLNFGQQGFKYTPPTGYVALNTYNLPDSTIVAGNKVMDATTYTGNNTTNVITNTGGFKPDLVWLKGRSNATVATLQDSVRGVNKYVIPSSTGAEGTDGSLTSFNSNGFSLTTDLGNAYNYNGYSYVGWQWQAGQGTTSSNTSGSITSTVSVNASAGFSIATFTSPSSGAYTVGHGLGIAPSLVISKERNVSGIWSVYHISTGDGRLQLQSTAAVTTGVFTTAPTSSTIWFPSSYADGSQRVAYCWSEIAGFSKFFSFGGNGSTDNAFIYCGFRPKWVLIKRTDSTSNWFLLDTSRSPYNVSNALLRPNLSDAEVTATNMDLLSNGIKIRDAGFGSGETYIGIAFAENPFRNALAR